MLALDHVHYSRWLWVFLHAFERLEDTNENIFQNLMEGRFVVNKSGRPFSCIAEGQAHEQKKWAISGLVLVKILEQGETKKLGKNAHHEDTDLHEKTFGEESSRYLESFKAMANPLREDEECLVNIESKHVLNKDASESVKSA